MPALRGKWIVLEALLFLVLASLMAAMLPFRWLALSIGGNADGRSASPPAARRIARAIAIAARRTPWRVVCLQRGLAAQWMLRRRGLAGSLYYGARIDDTQRLVAHVWTMSGAVPVEGCEESDRFGLLAVFPQRGDIIRATPSPEGARSGSGDKP